MKVAQSALNILLLVMILRICPVTAQEMIWETQLGGDGNDYIEDVIEDSQGNFVLVGRTRSFGNGRAGSSDVWLVKLNNIGDTLFTRTFGGAGDDEGEGVVETDDGGYVITGTTTPAGSYVSEIYLVRTDSQGKELRSATYGSGSNYISKCITANSTGGFSVGGGKSIGFGVGLILTVDKYLNVTDTREINRTMDRVVVEDFVQSGSGDVIGYMVSCSSHDDSPYFARHHTVYMSNFSCGYWSATYPGYFDRAGAWTDAFITGLVVNRTGLTCEMYVSGCTFTDSAAYTCIARINTEDGSLDTTSWLWFDGHTPGSLVGFGLEVDSMIVIKGDDDGGIRYSPYIDGELQDSVCIRGSGPGTYTDFDICRDMGILALGSAYEATDSTGSQADVVIGKTVTNVLIDAVFDGVSKTGADCPADRCFYDLTGKQIPEFELRGVYLQYGPNGVLRKRMQLK